VLRTVLTIASTAVLARLLTPADYGLVAMSTVVTEMAALLGFFGMTPLIVQRRRLTRLDLDSAFWISVALGFGVAAIVVATSFPAASFLPRAAHRADPVGGVVQFVLEDLSIIHHSIANRLLLFKLEFVSQFANLLVRIGVSIALARGRLRRVEPRVGRHCGPCRAIRDHLVRHPVRAQVALQRGIPARQLARGRQLFRLGRVHVRAGSLDTAVVGRTFGPTQLGYYQTAFALPEEMRSRLSFSMQKVVFRRTRCCRRTSPRFATACCAASASCRRSSCRWGSAWRSSRTRSSPCCTAASGRPSCRSCASPPRSACCARCRVS
jgi:PST family polysaccharide transporter